MGQVERKPTRIYLFLNRACQPPAGQRWSAAETLLHQQHSIASRRVSGQPPLTVSRGFQPSDCNYYEVLLRRSGKHADGEVGPADALSGSLSLSLLGKFMDAIEMLQY
jgi:hypothetical protein